MKHLLTFFVFSLLVLAPSARADWIALGAAYKCDAGRLFELRATVETSSPSDTVRPVSGFTPLKEDELIRLSCAVGRRQVDALIRVWSPGATGMCAGSGDVSIESFKVNGKPILATDDRFNMACAGGPAVISVRVQGARVKVCRGEWDWGKGYHNVKCSSAPA